MDLNLIKVFVEIVDSSGLSAAARKLDITRSNISQRLKRLERETGAQLLRRSTRSFELTQAGKVLYDCGRRMMIDLVSAPASIDSFGQTLRGQVRTACRLVSAECSSSSNLLSSRACIQASR